MKDIFSYNLDIDKNAYMNWRTNKHEHINNMIVIAKGFMMSSIILAEQMLNNNTNKNADIVIYPILFNANHAIELYLKAISWTLNVILDKDKKIEGSHDIKQIFNVVCLRVNEFEKSKNLMLVNQVICCFIDEKERDNIKFLHIPIVKRRNCYY
ncbi:TPA: hypothetical protein LA460_000610 [Clostridium botulinum]|nr:hypothetical protein [Clostridium botulinum]HBJ1653198.1 hypothetical protein [Clostridium botulinum]